MCTLFKYAAATSGKEVQGSFMRRVNHVKVKRTWTCGKGLEGTDVSSAVFCDLFKCAACKQPEFVAELEHACKALCIDHALLHEVPINTRWQMQLALTGTDLNKLQNFTRELLGSKKPKGCEMYIIDSKLAEQALA